MSFQTVGQQKKERGAESGSGSAHVIQQLQREAVECSQLAALREHPGYVLLERAVRERYEQSGNDLRRCAPADVRAYQVELDALEGVLNLVPGAVERGRQVQQELLKLMEEENDDDAGPGQI